MKVISWFDLENKNFSLENLFCHDENALKRLKNGVSITVGGFDGPHLGHKVIFDTVFSNKDALFGLVTFIMPPRFAKEKEKFLGTLSTLNLRLSSFCDFGFDFVVLIDFSADFSRIKGRDFLDILCSSCFVRYFVVGEDFRCGYKQDTGLKELESYMQNKNILLQLVKSSFLGEKKISSSAIRRMILSKDFANAKKMLGFDYEIDCEDFEQIKESSNQVKLHFNDGFSQVLPPVGRYPVFIKTVFNDSCQEQKNSLCQAELNVESEFLRCRFHFDSDFGLIQAILFR